MAEKEVVFSLNTVERGELRKQQFEIHPAATLFPLMTDDEYEGLKQDIAENGQREPVVVWCGKLIDGRNRLKACEELQRQPDIAELDEDQDPWKYVISHNLHRRHLTTSQRAMVASKLANLKNGEAGNGRKVGVSNDTATMDDAAKQLNVGRATVARAKQVQEHGSESVKQAVEQGSLPVSLAAKLVKKVPDKAEQSKIVAKGVASVRETVAAKPEELEYADSEETEPNGIEAIAAARLAKINRTVRGLLKSFDDLKADIVLSSEVKIPYWLWDPLVQAIRKLRNDLHQAIPQKPCPYCSFPGSECKVCDGIGFVVTRIFNSEPPDWRQEAEDRIAERTQS